MSKNKSCSLYETSRTNSTIYSNLTKEGWHRRGGDESLNHLWSCPLILKCRTVGISHKNKDPMTKEVC